jgi:two-component system LytT family sensor kinase
MVIGVIDIIDTIGRVAPRAEGEQRRIRERYVRSRERFALHDSMREDCTRREPTVACAPVETSTIDSAAVRRRRIEPWVLVSIAWIVPALFGALDTTAQWWLYRDGSYPIRQVLFTAIDWLLYGAITPAVFVLARRWPLVRAANKAPIARRIALHIILSLLFCVVWATLGTLLRLVIAPGSIGGSVWLSLVSWVFVTFPFGVAVYFAVVGTEHATRYFREAREQEVQVAKLSAQLTGARLSALQAQLNPHFLFNSLNTIAVLVRDGNGSGATRVIEQLSDVLRHTLGRTGAHEVALDDELELVRQYLAVEQARFSDRLVPAIDVATNARNAAVPAFAIQHLVENAIRHGIARRSDAGQLTVSVRRDGDALLISVADDGIGVTPGTAPERGHGIENTRERLRTLYGDAASLTLAPQSPFGTVARLRIPYRELVLEASHGE